MTATGPAPAASPDEPSGSRHRWRTAAALTGCGVAVALAMPPWGWWPLALVGLVGLDRLLDGRSAASRFRRGLLFGVAWFYPSTVWMLDFSQPGYLVAGFVLALFVATAAYAVPPGPGRVLALPGAVALAELARSTIPFGGVPLSTLAMSQVASPLTPLCRLGGDVVLTLGLLGVVVALGASAARRWRAALLAVAAVVALLAVALAVPRAQDVDTIRVALVQGGGPQRTRATDTDAQDVFDRHVAATELIDGPVDLVVWPENVVNLDSPLAGSAAGRTLVELARRLDAPILAGVVEDVGPTRFTNYSVLVNPDGTFGDRYDKVLRVPFGEYVPFRSLLNRLSGGALDRFVPRDAIAGNRPAVVETRAGPVGVVISWEVFFERRVRDAARHGAELIANPTNGSSYWLTIVQSQQVASSRLRALASDRWVLQTAPTGFSAIVDPDGGVRQRSAVSEQRVLQAEVTMREGLDPAMRFGPLPWAGLALVLVGAGWLVERRRRPAAVEQPTARPPGEGLSPPSPAGA